MPIKKFATAPVAKEEVQEPTIRWAIRETKVDPKTTLRTVVRVGPCTCEVCGYDPVEANKQKFFAESYEELDEEGQLIARNVLKKHRERHGPAEIAAAEVRNRELAEKFKYRT